MYFAKLDNSNYLIRLERGEEIIDSIKSFCTMHAVKNASVSGIGSVHNPKLAHYSVNSQKYSEMELEGIFELTSLLGSVADGDGNLLIHLHAAICDEQMNAKGGHLVSGLASATIELLLTVYPTAYKKIHDEAIGLKLWDLPEHI